ncbi:histidine kinase [Pseudoxanthomonas broegbernensis]|uniref:histidine kinase n=1 Tax=Pseudoxanthomonas broegbernensis TaxID=83619 RepID=A0A7V8GPN5_9GAMM|nr:sensor histidine kinase [Pseudoxanthomonas broegbernensis]KAF1687882.1 histidine kinase [Pseudoxanthomonas broegbernensis]MBB6064871.1 signal transduction histidine kinase [Pseudoxanthomonas broegbernensis]
MQANVLERSFVRWRLPILFSVMVLILLVPYLLVRQWTAYSRQADTWVTHTLQVEASAQRLQAAIREIDSLGLAIGGGHGDDELKRRLEAAVAAVDPILRQLAAMTRDNPEQQVLIGRLQNTVERRAEIARLFSMGVSGDRRADLVDEVHGRYRVNDLFEEFARNERELMAERAGYAETQRLRVRWVSLGAMLLQLLLMGGVIWLLHRVERRQSASELELRRASARALAVLQTVREPIVLLDGGMRLLMHNAAFSELYAEEEGGDERQERLEDVGQGAWSDPVVRQRLSDVLTRDRELWDYEHVQRTIDGQTRTMLVNARRMQLPDRDDDVVLMTVSDISAQKAAQQRIGDLNRQLEGKIEQVSEVNRELEAFSYSVSHDLRAPLRHVAGFADKLSRHLGEGIDAKGRHYLEVIGGSARRMSTLIDDLLVYSRLGRSALKLQAVDMQSLAEETRAVLDANLASDAADAGTAEHRIEWNIAPLPIVIADENMMRQLWLNLLGNAVKYSFQREPAVIEVAHQTMADGSHHFSVCDNGVGFDMDYADKLFGVFQRLHKASEYPGTGIGLASVRRVLGRHGGRIWADAEPGRGATFHFVLPPAQDSAITRRSMTA